MVESGLRREIHYALDAIDRPAPHLPHLVARSIHEQARSRRRPRIGWWVAAAAVLVLGLLSVLMVVRVPGEWPHPGVPAGRSTPRSETAPWSENLTFRGGINAEVHATLPDGENICTSTVSGDFIVDLYLPAGDGSQNFKLNLLVVRYHGPGTYTDATRVWIANLENPDAKWGNSTEDKVTLTVGRDERSGSIDARVSPSFAGAQAPITVTGTWSCHTSL